jgi:hypothetical protein
MQARWAGRPGGREVEAGTIGRRGLGGSARGPGGPSPALVRRQFGGA